ncbi:YAP1-binding protein 1 [Paecilomyces lecythidis]|uniref:YAP1-binding protein 1 n=1 Tax=Paecilomyces lecythidis TaxID=3004212 RepID=A0ABR3XK60_9EURO
MAEEEDPLVQTLPPATDYLTYLTLLEYQLTPARLPLLHKLLQDETLTTNIGWDLVQLLLPMLPESQDCLQDVARLGNPREVILRVSDALMKLQPEEDDEETQGKLEESDNKPEGIEEVEEQLADTAIESDDGSDDGTRKLPRFVVQFNCLLAMLSVLHSRIKTKYPSRFIATSLQAALEAYTLMPTNETTTALLEFFRDVSPLKRPALPPRAASESSVIRVSQASAPDPEAETHSHPSSSDENELLKRLLQFGLIELLKAYMLSLTNPADSGMCWAIRLHEQLHPESRIPSLLTKTDHYGNSKALRERDMILGKITALSRDFGIDDQKLLRIVSIPPEEQPPLLDFEEVPKSADEIPLERHGSLLLLAARLTNKMLFSSGQEILQVPVFPDLAHIFFNFIGKPTATEGVNMEQPQVLLDALLALTVASTEKLPGTISDDKEYEDFVLTLTACTSRQIYNTIRRLPAAVVHSHPSSTSRFKLIRRALEKETLHFARDSAIGWLKDEILSAADMGGATTGKTAVSSPDPKVFADPHYFSVLFPLLFNSTDLLLDTTSGFVASWLRFSQSLAPSIHAALSLYYVLLSSPKLCQLLELEKTYPYFRNKFLGPLKSLCRTFESDLSKKGGDGRIESAIGEELCEIGMARSVGLITLLIEQVEDTLADAFDLEEAAMKEPSADDIAKVAEIRTKTAP